MKPELLIARDAAVVLDELVFPDGADADVVAGLASLGV
jgi:hypothetical protein